MDGNISIDFREIRPHEGDKRKGFEELICQLARREKEPGAREFRRIEGAGGDAGVEAYWIFEDGTKHGYQAKYFLTTKDIGWAQIDESVKAALEHHPELKEYTIALACDLTDRSGKMGKGKTGWEQWETHKIKWRDWAKSQGIAVDFLSWTKSEIADHLITNTANHGLILYWFNAQLFNDAWFQKLFERAKADLGERFQPEDHVEVDLKKAVDGLARSPAYLNFLSKWFCDLPSTNDLIDELNKLDSSLENKLIRDLEEKCTKVRGIGATVQTYENRPFPLQDWQGAIKEASESIQPILTWLYDQDTNKKQDSRERAARKAITCLSKIDSHLDHTPIHLFSGAHDIRVEADVRRLLLVVGEAGSGKSHLFADSVLSSLNNNAPAILLLGQYFPGQDIRREFLSCLDLANHDFEKVVQALNAVGEAAHRRLFILVDALNEAHSLRIWHDQLAGFATDILNYKWIAIGFSLRPEYEDRLVPETVRSNAARAACWGIQSPAEQEQAEVQYFEKRGITRPAVPWLSPEFSNFLFLKTCCDALKELGIKEFPRGLRGSLQVLKFYLNSIDSKLRRSFPNVQIPKSAITGSIRKIAKIMARDRCDYIGFKQAADVCEAEFGCRGPSVVSNWSDLLACEGVFRRDHIFVGDKGEPFSTAEDIYRFTYQRFSDHLIVQALLDNVDDIHDAFGSGATLGFLVQKDGSLAWSTLWNALAVQIPEKFPGQEIIDALSLKANGSSYNQMIFEAFEQSLLWRSSAAFSDHTLDLFNKLPLAWKDSRLNILFRLAILQNHPWNAELLDLNLQRRSLSERDQFWTVEINEMSEDDHPPLWGLIRWCLNANLDPAETETLRLAAITLAWTCTSSNRPLRDSATKALISIFANRPELIPVIVDRFQNVDDLYVMERICVAILGAITRGVGAAHIQVATQAIYRNIFNRETPHLSIILRDYARAIIEFASQQGSLDKDVDIKKCRPPYRSEWPLIDVTEEEIDKIAEQAGGNQIKLSAFKWGGDFGIYEIPASVHHFTKVPLERPRPLNDVEREEAFKHEIKSWDLEKQAAFLKLEIAVKALHDSFRFGGTETRKNKKLSISFSYSPKAIKAVTRAEASFLSLLNKEEHTFYEQIMMPVMFPDRVPYENRQLPKFDQEFAKRWIVKKAYKYGWNKELFPNDSGTYDGRNRPKIERIGKKYQWLALYELMSRLSDNVWSIGKWPERAIIYDHPATGWFVRDVEPSILTDPARDPDKQFWWQAVPLKLAPIGDNGLRTWPFETEPPTVSTWMDVIAPDGTPWLLLYGFFDVRERWEKENIVSHSFKRDTFVRVSTILVRSDEVKAAMTVLKGKRLADPSEQDAIDWTDGPFLCEYPWRNTWQSDYGIFEEGDMENFGGIKYIRPIARHVWESHLDLSLQHGASMCIPNPWIGRKLGLKADLDHFGEFIHISGGQRIFMDPTVDVPASSAALINKTVFFDFLKAEGLECLWIVAGEHNSWPSDGGGNDYSCRSFAGIYRWAGRKWTGYKWHNDEGRNSNG